jgi:hypothetical protein
VTTDVTGVILDHARELCKRHDLSFILLSTLSKPMYETFASYRPLPFPHAGTMVLDLQVTPPQAIWDNVFSTVGSGVPRKYIRRFEKEGFHIRDTRAPDDLQRFYQYYAENLDFIEATPYPRSHFDCCLQHFPSDELRMTLLEKEGEVYGGLFALISWPKKTMYLKYLALNRQTPNRYHPPYALYWEAIQHAHAKGLRFVSFGSTPVDPENVTHRMKQKFGTVFVPEYRAVLSTSALFAASYKAYRLVKR